MTEKNQERIVFWKSSEESVSVRMEWLILRVMQNRKKNCFSSIVLDSNLVTSIKITNVLSFNPGLAFPGTYTIRIKCSNMELCVNS